MVLKTPRCRPTSEVPEEPHDGRFGLLSDLGSAKNGGMQANTEGKDTFPGSGDTDISRDDVQRDKIRPLLSLDANKVLKRSSLPMRHSSLKAVLAATKGSKGPNAQEKGSVISLEDDKENTDVEANEQSTIPLPCKRAKQRCSNVDASSDGSNNSTAFLRRRKSSVHVSTCQNEADKTNCQEECEFSSFSERIHGPSSDFDALKKLCSSSCAEVTRDFPCAVDTFLVPPPLHEDLRSTDSISNEANALPLFEFSDDLKPSTDVFSKDNGNGLSILGAAVFLSLGMDEALHGSGKKSECISGQIVTSKDYDKTQATNTVANGCCSSIGNRTSDETIKQSSPNLGADLTLGLPVEFSEKMNGNQNNANVDEIINFLRDEFSSVSEGSLLNKKIYKKDCVTEAVPQPIEILSIEKQLLKRGKTYETMVSAQTCIDAPLKSSEDAGMEAITQPQLGDKVASCPLNADYHIKEDRMHWETVGSKRLAGQKDTIRDYMRFSDLLQGTLLLPRGQKRARRIPIQHQRLKNEALKQKREIGKKEQVSKFAKVTGPSGLLADLNPGIINRVRNSKQVHAIIEAVVGSVALNAYQDSQQNFQQGQGRTNKSERAQVQERNQTAAKVLENGDSEIVDPQQGGYDLLEAGYGQTNSETTKGKLEERMTSAVNSCVSDQLFNGEERHTDANPSGEAFVHQATIGDSILSTDCNGDGFCSNQIVAGHNNLQGTFSCFCDYCNPTEGPTRDFTCSRSLSLKAATVASQWLDLHYQDVKGRLAALKRSRKRVRAVLKEQFGCNLINHTTSNASQDDKLYVQTSNNDRDADSALHVEKWRSLFIHMDNCLNVEGAQLENNLQQIKEMQTHCMWGLEEVRGISSECHNVQLPRTSEDKLRFSAASAEVIKRQFALSAAAASIYSTANFARTMEDVPCF